MSSESIKHRSPLESVHVAAGARMVDFAGWAMPVQYRGVLEEHHAVRSQAGIFDVSHMGEANVSGSAALEFLQSLTCNDVSRLKPGRAQYTAMTTPDGTFVDDILIYRLADQEYMLVLNAGNLSKDLAWLESHAGEYDAAIRDDSADLALVAVQGPLAAEIVQSITDLPLDKIRYYRFRQGEVAGTPCIVSRTGYTGEDGFELYAPADRAVPLWEAIVAAGGPRGLMPAGLAARDTLRLEAKMALYGNDIDETTSVYEADLGWIVKPDKGEFIGRAALARQAEEGVRRKLVGFEMESRAIARQGYAALHDDLPVGRVTSGSFAPYLKKNIGLAYLPVEIAEPGIRFEIEIRRKREPARVVPTPFYKRAR